MYIVVQRLLIHIFPLLFHILQIAEKSESRKVIFEINPLIFRMPIVYLQLVNNVKNMKQVRLLNTKSDACRPSEFIGDYHIHIIVREGSMAFSDRRQMHIASNNDFVIWQMSNTIEDVSYSDDFEADFLLVSSDFLGMYNPEMIWAAKGYIFIRMNPVFHLDNKALESLNSDFLQFQNRLANEDALFHNDVIGRVLQIFLFDIWNVYSTSIQNMQTDDNSARIFLHFLNLAQKHSLTNRDVAFYASELNISPKYLSQISLIVSNQPASTWIEYYAAFEIVRLLDDQSLTLTEIADRMQFSSNSYLTRYCKRVTGMTPTEYRFKKGI
jgi:AraC family transcriptional activator of pobA